MEGATAVSVSIRCTEAVPNQKMAMSNRRKCETWKILLNFPNQGLRRFGLI
jgi:hypothetical protein